MYRVKEIFTFQIKIRLNKWLICAILTRVLVHVAKTCPIYSPNSNTEEFCEQIFTADAIHVPYMFFCCHQAIKIINCIQNIDFVNEKSFFLLQIFRRQRLTECKLVPVYLEIYFLVAESVYIKVYVHAYKYMYIYFIGDQFSTEYCIKL